MSLRRFAIALALVMTSAPAFAQNAEPFTPKIAGEVLDVLDMAMDGYVFPKTAAVVKASLKDHRAALTAAPDAQAFAKAVTDDIRAAGHDKHLSVRPPQPRPAAAPGPAPSARAMDQSWAYGFMAVRRLPGNIGYLKLNRFADDPAAAAMIEQSLTLLKDTDALIIDLRQHRGGGGAADETLLGHLSRTPIPMAQIHWRGDDGRIEIEARHAATPANGPLYADKPVFLLTSVKTFSAAEEFAYDLKAAGRAVLVGETTGGGANPANRNANLGHGFSAFIPNGEAVHPTTKTNWEGVGVAPDVPADPNAALTKAYELALKAAKPAVVFAASERERAAALADPAGVLAADQAL